MNPANSDVFQTTCTQCNSVFSLNEAQLLAADGKVRCSECDEVFDANIHLETVLPIKKEPYFNDNEKSIAPENTPEVSLSEAMNDGKTNHSSLNLKPLYWSTGLLALVFISLLQWLYFDRHQLIKNPQYQDIILSLCNTIKCDSSQFKNSQQFTLIERNIFTHPTRSDALLISGSFVNEAPFSQPTPQLKVSLFNLQGKVIAQRYFNHQEYKQNTASLTSVAPGESIHFKLEVEDPNTVTITYEFEFI